MSNFFNNASLRSPFPWLALLYLLSAKGHLEIIDTEYSVRTALAIVEDGSMLIEVVDPQVLEIAPKVEGTEKIHSQYGLGLVVIFLPIVLLGKVLAGIGGLDQRVLIDFLLSFYNVPFAILGLWFFRSILLRLGASEPRATAAVVLLGATTAFWKYAVTDFSEVTQVAFLLGALHAVLSDSPAKWRRVSLWCALLVAMKVAYVVLLPIFALYAWLEKEGASVKERFRPILDYACFLVPLGLLLALANHLRFGSPLETGYGSQAASFSMEYFRRDWFDYLFSTQRGILPFNPILLAALPGWFLVPAAHRRFTFFCLGLFLFWFVFMCFWKSLQGGWCWGNRLLVPLLPLAFLPFAFVPLRSTFAKAGIGVLAVVSLVIQTAAAATKTHECAVLRGEITAATSRHTPNQLPSTLRVFLHKVTEGGTHYNATVLGVNADATIDLSAYDSFRGLNLWPAQAAKFLGSPAAVRPVSLALLFLLLAILAHLAHHHVRPILRSKPLSSSPSDSSPPA